MERVERVERAACGIIYKTAEFRYNRGSWSVYKLPLLNAVIDC